MLKFGNTFVNVGGTYLTGWDMLLPYTLRGYATNGVCHVYPFEDTAQSSCTGWSGNRATVAVSGNPGYYLSGVEKEGAGSFSNKLEHWGTYSWRGYYTFGEGDCNISAYFSDNVSSQYVFRYNIYPNLKTFDVKLNKFSKRPVSAWYGTVGEAAGHGGTQMTDTELDSLTSTNSYFTYSFNNQNDFGLYAVFDSPTTALTLYDNTNFSAGSVYYALEKEITVIGGSYTTTLASSKSYWCDNTQSWATHCPIKNVSITADI